MDNIIEKIKKKSKFISRNVYEINGEKYYCKVRYTPENVINEFVAYKLAKEVDIDVVEPFKFLKKDKIVLVSKNYVPRGFLAINGSDIMEKYLVYLMNNKLISIDEYNKLSADNINNLSDIWNALEYHMNNAYKKVDKDIINNIMFELVKRFSFDILTLQTDRGSVNWEILESGNISEFRLAPLFDNEYAFLGNSETNFLKSRSSLIVGTTADESNDKTIKEVLVEFLNTSSSEFVSIFVNIFNKLDISRFNEIVDEVSKENSDISSILYINKIKQIYENNYNEIKEILKELNLINSEDDNYAR